MISDTERREVARRLRHSWANVPDKNPVRHQLRVLFEIYSAVGLADDDDADAIDLFDRLADLIEPTDGFDIDTVQRACLECMEGCDEPEWTLYTTIHDAIARYKRGESGPTCDRDALLRLSDEIYDTSCDNHGELSVDLVDIWGWAQAISEALGVES